MGPWNFLLGLLGQTSAFIDRFMRAVAAACWVVLPPVGVSGVSSPLYSELYSAANSMNGRIRTRKLQPPTVLVLVTTVAEPGRVLKLLLKFCNPRPICFKLLVQLLRKAASRAALIAGNSRAIRMPMMTITTSSSTRVNPRPL